MKLPAIHTAAKVSQEVNRKCNFQPPHYPERHNAHCQRQTDRRTDLTGCDHAQARDQDSTILSLTSVVLRHHRVESFSQSHISVRAADDDDDSIDDLSNVVASLKIHNKKPRCC